jgi:hypothetical protein
MWRFLYMISSKCNRLLSTLGLALAAMLMPCILVAAEGRIPKSGKTVVNPQTVEMFSAIEKGQIAVKLIPKDSSQSRVMIENKTDKPLTVKLPDTFAGVPVLAQARPGGAGAGTGSSGNNSNQSMGGGMGGMGGGGMGGMGMGMMNIAPEKVGQLRVTTVCLEHGKAEPRANIPYEIKPLENVTNKPAVAELCRMLGTGQLNQRAAQAAAWVLNNDMTWQNLSAKRLKLPNGAPGQLYFSPQEIKLAMQAAAMAVKTAEEKQKQNHYPDSSTQTSPSQQ